MKVAFVVPPETGEWNLMFEAPDHVRLVPLVGVKKLWRVAKGLGGALVVAAVIVAFWGMKKAGPEDALRETATGNAPSAQSRWRVSQFDASQPLKRGDVVVVHQNGASAVREITAASKEGVLLKQGNNLRGFYLVGEGRYLITSGGDAKIVRNDEIFATVSPAEAR